MNKWQLDSNSSIVFPHQLFTKPLGKRSKPVKHNPPQRKVAYSAWNGMRQRCYYRKHKSFPYYGGRGIGICQRWVFSFESFLEDMGPPPKSMTLERKDYDGPYAPWNCHWVTWREQGNNKRSVRMITFNGVTRSRREWERHFGTGKNTIKYRLERGWSIEKSLTTPVANRKGKKE